MCPPRHPHTPRRGAEDVKLTKSAPLEKGHFTWITEKGRQERWVVASCGNYTVLWNFRCVGGEGVPGLRPGPEGGLDRWAGWPGSRGGGPAQQGAAGRRAGAAPAAAAAARARP